VNRIYMGAGSACLIYKEMGAGYLSRSRKLAAKPEACKLLTEHKNLLG